MSQSQISVDTRGIIAPPTIPQVPAVIPQDPPMIHRAPQQSAESSPPPVDPPAPIIPRSHTLPLMATREEVASDLLRSLPAVMTRDAVERLVAKAEHRLVDRLSALERRQHRIASDSSQCLRLLKRIATAPHRRTSGKVNLEIDDVFETDA